MTTFSKRAEEDKRQLSQEREQAQALGEALKQIRDKNEQKARAMREENGTLRVTLAQLLNR